MINIKMPTAKHVQRLSPVIFVVGCGGAGGNAIDNMIASDLEGCQFIACNADAQALENSRAPIKVQLGAHVTGGLGAGSKPDIGKAAAEESLEEVMSHLEGANMVFITAGMGGGTGTGGGNGGGLGLGLSISSGIVQDFGGTIAAANCPGGGAEFTVRLQPAEEPR